MNIVLLLVLNIILVAVASWAIPVVFKPVIFSHISMSLGKEYVKNNEKALMKMLFKLSFIICFFVSFSVYFLQYEVQSKRNLILPEENVQTLKK